MAAAFSAAGAGSSVAENVVRSFGRARRIAGSDSGRVGPPRAFQPPGRASGAAGSFRKYLVGIVRGLLVCLVPGTFDARVGEISPVER